MSDSPSIVSFGAFEADLESGELRKYGLRIPLADQSFTVLTILLRRPGEVISRAELQERLWPGQSYVDADHGLNKAVNRLRRSLGDTAARPRYVETLARRGYRFLMPVRVPAQRPPGAGGPATRARLAVLPFKNLGADPGHAGGLPEQGQDFFSDGLTEEMISELGRAAPARLAVIAGTSAMQYKNTSKRVDQIGQELNVDYILEGSVQRIEDRARIIAHLIQVRDQTQLWAETFDRDLTDLFRVQRDVAQRVAASLALTVLPSTTFPGRSTGPEAPEAYEAYLRGRYFWSIGNDTSTQTAIVWFQRAIAHDPHYSLAHAALADCYGRLVWFGAMRPLDAGAHAKAAAIRAVELDPSQAHGHASLALVRFWFDWDWAEAEREFRRSIELGPNYADAHNWYGAFLNVMGRLPEAAAMQRAAEEIDPLSLTIAMNAAAPLHFSRRYDLAIEQLQAVLQREPRFFPAQYNLGRSYVEKGMYSEALAAFEQTIRLSGSRLVLAPLANACGLAGDAFRARTLLAELEELSGKYYVAAPMISWVHLGLGEASLALDRLEQGFEERSCWMIYLHADPVYDSIRSHPRFVRLLTRLGLPLGYPPETAPS